MFTFPSSMFSSSGGGAPPFNSLLDKTAAYFTFDNTTSDLISPDSTGDYRFYFQYDSANYTTGLVGSSVQPYLDGGGTTPEMYIQTVAGADLETDANFDLPSIGFISINMWIAVTNYYGSGTLPIFSNNATAETGDYGLGIVYNSGTFIWEPTLFTNDDANTQYQISSSTELTVDEWYLIGFEINKVTGGYKFRINNDTPITGTGIFTSYATNSARPKFFKSSSTEGGYKVDRLHVCNAALTDPEWDYLYDSGSGTTSYPFSSFV